MTRHAGAGADLDDRPGAGGGGEEAQRGARPRADRHAAELRCPLARAVVSTSSSGTNSSA